MMPAAPAGSDLAQGPDASVVGERGEAPPRVAHVLPHQHQTRHGNSPRRQPGDAPARQFPRPPGAPPQSRQGRRDRRGPLRRVGPGGQRACGAVRGGVAPVPPAGTSDRTVGGGGAVGGGRRSSTWPGPRVPRRRRTGRKIRWRDRGRIGARSRAPAPRCGDGCSRGRRPCPGRSARWWWW